MSDTNKDKEHADFQDSYRRSSNFGKTDSEDPLKVAGDGEVKLSKEGDTMSKSDKQKISDAMDSMQQRMEITPGGDQSDTTEEE